MMQNVRKYDNYISLGWYCGTASSMARGGLRSHSGPFDWYFSDLESVLEMMGTDFRDFLKKENLVVETGKTGVFYDAKYGFRYVHDMKSNLETEYSYIYQKYMRRVEYFRQNIYMPTCFVRCVRSEKEIQFIEENKDFIYKVIKKGNSDNEIIFLLLDNMKSLSDDWLWFRLGIDKYGYEVYEMRTMFDSVWEFSKFCRNNICMNERIESNIAYDRKHLKLSYKALCLMKKVNKIDNIIMNIFREYYPDIDYKGVFLWGMGYFGKIMLQILIKSEIRINGLIDNSLDKVGTFCEGIPIIPFCEINQDNQNIFIAVSSDEMLFEIRKQIVSQYPDTNIFDLFDLCRHPNVEPIFINF